LSSYGKTRKSTNVLPIAIGITIILSLSPASWLGWTTDLADLVRVPVTPFSHVGIMVTSWVRPAIDPSDLPTDEQERNDLAIAERDHYRKLWTAQMLRATELADQLREIQSLPNSALRNPLPPMIVQIDITGRDSSNIAGFLELKIIRGTSDRIRVGDIAVIGQDIVGRISRVGMTRAELIPTNHNDIGLTRAAIIPSHPSNQRPPLLAEVILQSTGEASMIAEVPATSGVQTGDLVQLDDSSWPSVGAGLTLGVVTDVIQLDEAPLRQRVLISPRRRARDVSRVVVLGTGEGESQ
jgi:cell shape-determining protein MreC